MKKFFVAIICLTAFSLFSQTKTSIVIRQINAEKLLLKEQQKELEKYADLLEERKQINSLISQNKTKKVIKLFTNQTKIIDKYLKKNQVESANAKFNRVKIIFQKADFLEDLLLYYKSKIVFAEGENEVATKLLQQLITEYPNSTKRDFAIVKLENIYFQNGLNWEYIEIYNQSNTEKTELQKYHFAHCNYNIGNIEDAKKIFQGLTKTKKFGFRSESMLALISYFSEGADKAIVEFQILENKNKATKTPHYYFILLSLARLFADKNESEKSLEYYDKYYQLQLENVGAEVLYEIASQYKNVKNYDMALTYLRRIIKVPQKTKYFAPAKFLIAMIEHELGDYDSAEQHLDDVILPNEEFLATLTSKYDLLNEYNRLRKKIVADSADINSQKQLAEVENKLETMSRAIKDYYTELDSASVQTLQELETEYLHYCETITDMEAVIELKKTTQNTELLPIIDETIEKDETSLLILQIMKYLANAKNITNIDYQIAKALASERIYEESLLNMWTQIEQTAKLKNADEIFVFAKKSKNLVQNNIQSLDLIAKYKFNPQMSDELSDVIKMQAENIEKNKKDLLVLRDDVLNNLNKKIAQKLEKKKNVLSDEFEEIKILYQQSIAAISDYIGRENVEGSLTLLDVLFKKSQKMDEEYERLKENKKQDE